MKTVNLNDKVRVKPTELGLALLEMERNNLIGYCPSADWSTWRKVDANGFIEIQLWEAMQIFGYRMSNGSPLVIETEIVIL